MGPAYAASANLYPQIVIMDETAILNHRGWTRSVVASKGDLLLLKILLDEGAEVGVSPPHFPSAFYMAIGLARVWS